MWNKNLALLLASVLCLNLAACGFNGGITGTDWRTWDIVADGGTITRGGEGTDILVCVHKADATFYYDEEVQTLFAYVDYPITLADNAWGMYQGIDFSDLNGDGNSDVTILSPQRLNSMWRIGIWFSPRAIWFTCLKDMTDSFLSRSRRQRPMRTT